MSVINERIKQQRLSLNLTLSEVADLIGVKEATVQRYESGAIKNISHETICKLSDVLRCSPSYLMGWEENTPAVAPVLEDREQKLLSSFALLNDSGQEEALKRVEELTELPKYKK